MELLGKSLEDIFNKLPIKKMSIRCVCNIGIQMINIIKFVHDKHIIHRDIKPDNFVIGLGENKRNLYLLDFGLAKKYRSSVTLKHYEMGNKKKLTGTARYSSINALSGYEQSRRDDLESIGYVLLYFLRGNLPWQGLPMKNKNDRYGRILEKKKTTSSYELCKDFPNEFSQFVEYTRKLKYEENPDYDFLIKLFNDVLKKDNFRFDYFNDWDLNYDKYEKIEKNKEDFIKDNNENNQETKHKINNNHNIETIRNNKKISFNNIVKNKMIENKEERNNKEIFRKRINNENKEDKFNKGTFNNNYNEKNDNNKIIINSPKIKNDENKMIEIPKTNISIIEENRIEPLDNFIDKKKERINQIININTSADKDNSPNEQLDNNEFMDNNYITLKNPLQKHLFNYNVNNEKKEFKKNEMNIISKLEKIKSDESIDNNNFNEDDENKKFQKQIINENKNDNIQIQNNKNKKDKSLIDNKFEKNDKSLNESNVDKKKEKNINYNISINDNDIEKKDDESINKRKIEKEEDSYLNVYEEKKIQIPDTNNNLSEENNNQLKRDISLTEDIELEVKSEEKNNSEIMKKDLISKDKGENFEKPNSFLEEKKSENKINNNILISERINEKEELEKSNDDDDEDIIEKINNNETQNNRFDKEKNELKIIHDDEKKNNFTKNKSSIYNNPQIISKKENPNNIKDSNNEDEKRKNDFINFRSAEKGVSINKFNNESNKNIFKKKEENLNIYKMISSENNSLKENNSNYKKNLDPNKYEKSNEFKTNNNHQVNERINEINNRNKSFKDNKIETNKNNQINKLNEENEDNKVENEKKEINKNYISDNKIINNRQEKVIKENDNPFQSEEGKNNQNKNNKYYCMNSNRKKDNVCCTIM